MNAEKSRLVEEAWSSVASAYRSYWSPRFEPYLERAVEAFRPAPQGALVVAGCGPGDEVILLARKFPGRPLIATDISPGMVDIAHSRVVEAGLRSVLVAQDDACQVSGRVRQAAGVLSCFVLQLLPNPTAALADWSRAIRRTGSISVLFWPRREGRSPFARLSQVLRKRLGDERGDWEDRLLEELPGLGLRLAADESVEHEMVHESPEELWRELCQSGPLQVTLKKMGAEALAAIGAEWLEDHGLERRGGRWVHRPQARLLRLERSGREEAH